MLALLLPLGRPTLAAPLDQPAFVTNAYFTDLLLESGNLLRPNAAVNVLAAERSGVVGYFVMDLLLQKGDHGLFIEILNSSGVIEGKIEFNPLRATVDLHNTTTIGVVNGPFTSGWLTFAVYDNTNDKRYRLGTFRVLTKLPPEPGSPAPAADPPTTAQETTTPDNRREMESPSATRKPETPSSVQEPEPTSGKSSQEPSPPRLLPIPTPSWVEPAPKTTQMAREESPQPGVVKAPPAATTQPTVTPAIPSPPPVRIARTEPQPVATPKDDSNPPAAITTGKGYMAQLSSSNSAEGAAQLAQKLRAKGLPAFSQSATGSNKKNYYRVCLGPYSTEQEARTRGAAAVKDEKLGFSVIVRDYRP